MKCDVSLCLNKVRTSASLTVSSSIIPHFSFRAWLSWWAMGMRRRPVQKNLPASLLCAEVTVGNCLLQLLLFISCVSCMPQTLTTLRGRLIERICASLQCKMFVLSLITIRVPKDKGVSGASVEAILITHWQSHKWNRRWIMKREYFNILIAYVFVFQILRFLTKWKRKKNRKVCYKAR